MTADLRHIETDEDIVRGARALDRKAAEWLSLPPIEVPGLCVYAQREALRQATIRAHARAAHALLTAADRAYWQIAERNCGVFNSETAMHARRSRVDVDEVRGALRESAYRCAIEWNPARAPFATALRYHLRGGWQKSPSRQRAVALSIHATTTRDKGFGRVGVDSLEAHYLEDGSGGVPASFDWHDIDAQLDIEREAQRMRRAAEQLPPLQRALFDDLMSGVSQADAARARGVKRQRAGQVYMRMLAGLRAELGVAG